MSTPIPFRVAYEKDADLILDHSTTKKGGINSVLPYESDKTYPILLTTQERAETAPGSSTAHQTRARIRSQQEPETSSESEESNCDDAVEAVDAAETEKAVTTIKAGTGRTGADTVAAKPHSRRKNRNEREEESDEESGTLLILAEVMETLDERLVKI